MAINYMQFVCAWNRVDKAARTLTPDQRARVNADKAASLAAYKAKDYTTATALLTVYWPGAAQWMPGLRPGERGMATLAREGARA